MPSKTEDSLQLDVLRPHQDELLYLAELAGIQIDKIVFRYMVQLLNMRASPEVVFHLLKVIRRRGSSSRRKSSRTSTSSAASSRTSRSKQ